MTSNTPPFPNPETSNSPAEGYTWEALIDHTLQKIDEEIAKTNKYPTKRLRTDRMAIFEERQKLENPEYHIADEIDQKRIENLGVVISRYNLEELTLGTWEVYGIEPQTDREN